MARDRQLPTHTLSLSALPLELMSATAPKEPKGWACAALPVSMIASAQYPLLDASAQRSPQANASIHTVPACDPKRCACRARSGACAAHMCHSAAATWGQVLPCDGMGTSLTEEPLPAASRQPLLLLARRPSLRLRICGRSTRLSCIRLCVPACGYPCTRVCTWLCTAVYAAAGQTPVPPLTHLCPSLRLRIYAHPSASASVHNPPPLHQCPIPPPLPAVLVFAPPAFCPFAALSNSKCLCSQGMSPSVSCRPRHPVRACARHMALAASA